jgi:hypothetical protein
MNGIGDKWSNSAYLWLMICAAAGLAMAFLFVDSFELD